jgi:hypothetical protein
MMLLRKFFSGGPKTEAVKTKGPVFIEIKPS